MTARRHSRPRSRRGRGELDGCQDCRARLTPENWSPSNRERGRYLCRPCYSARQKAYQANVEPETLRARKAATLQRMKARDPERFNRSRYNSWLRRNYGMTLEEYDALLVKQNGVCAICKGGTRGRGRFHVDHCHVTNVVRGLLCAKCNLLLGHADDSTRLLRSAIFYLIDPPNNA